MEKVLLVIDQLVERNNATAILEHFLALFPEAHIATITHYEGAIGGKIEMAPIYSTYLSNMVNSVDDFKKKLFLIPGAIKALKLPMDYEGMISISSGFSHCFHIPGVKHYSYVYEWDYFFYGKIGFISRLSKMYLDNYRQQSLKNNQVISISNEHLATMLNIDQPKIISPFFKADKILYNDQINPFIQDQKVVVLANQANNEVINYLSTISNMAKKVFVIGVELKTLNANVSYMGEMTQDNLSKYCENAWVTFDLTVGEFPEFALAAMASGSPVCIRDKKINREIIGELEGVYYYSSKIDVDLSSIPKSKIDRRKLRRKALKYNGRIFKTKNLRYLTEKLWF